MVWVDGSWTESFLSILFFSMFRMNLSRYTPAWAAIEQALASLSLEYFLASTSVPMHARNPCCLTILEVIIFSITSKVSGDMERAQLQKKAGVHPPCLEYS